MFFSLFFILISSMVDLWATSSQELLDAFSQSFQGLVELCKGHDSLQSLHWHFETECSTAICIRALTPVMMQLHRVKFGELQCSNHERTFLFVYLRVVIGWILVYDLHSSLWHFRTRWTIEMSMGTFKLTGDGHVQHI